MNNEPIGNTDAVCPYCEQHLDKMPGRKKKCPHCGHFMFVRTRPSDNQRVLVTEQQAEKIEEQWAIVNGAHDLYRAKRERFSDEKASLAKRFGKEPSDNDVTWAILNQDMMEYVTQRQCGLFRNAKFDMAEILRKELRLDRALGAYLELCYIDLNGPSNVGGITEPELIREYPPWDPKNLGELAPGILERITKIIKKTDTSQSDVKTMFFEKAAEIKESLHLPVAVPTAWEQVQKELFQ